MTQNQARKHIQAALLTAVRFRSNALEYMQHFRELDHMADEEFLAGLFPWIFGGKSIVTGLSRMLDKTYLDPMDFYNACYVVNHLQPELAWAMLVLGWQDLPEPALSDMRRWISNGWDCEHNLEKGEV